jgi:hypothetical protein
VKQWQVMIIIFFLSFFGACAQRSTRAIAPDQQHAQTCQPLQAKSTASKRADPEAREVSRMLRADDTRQKTEAALLQISTAGEGCDQ